MPQTSRSHAESGDGARAITKCLHDCALWFERTQAGFTTFTAIVLVTLVIIPIWTVQFPPLQDYPIHLLRANIIAHYYDSAAHYADAFVISLAPIPYILTDYLISGLASLVPVTLAGKLTLTIYIILLPISSFYLIRSVDPEKSILGFSSFLLIHNRHFEKGNVSYFFSFPLFLFALGYWWRHRTLSTLRVRVVFSLLAFAVYLCHLYTFLFLVFAITILAALEFRNIWKVLRTLLPLLPSMILLVISVVNEVPQIQTGSVALSRDPVVLEYPSLKYKLLDVSNTSLGMTYLTNLSPRRERRIYFAAFMLFALLGIAGLRDPRNRIFQWLFLAFCFLYLLLPQVMAPGYDIAPRALIFLLLLAPLCVKLPSARLLRLSVVGALILLCMYSLLGTWKDYAVVGSNLHDIYAELNQIPASESASFRIAAADMYVGNVTPYALFGALYYLDKGAPRAGELGNEMSGVLRSVDPRHFDPPPPYLDAVFAHDLAPGGYIIVLERHQRSTIHALAENYGYRCLIETNDIGVFRRTRAVAGPNWFPGPYYSLGPNANYNYLLIFQRSSDEPDISKQFELVSSRGNAHLWRRRHLLDDRSVAESCIPCGDRP